MHFTDIYIDGFGLFCDFKINDLPKNLVLFLGDNEAGKTTFLYFIRGVLFGFPDKRTKGNRYPTLRGGEYGGRIHLLTEEGNPFIIERKSGARGGKLDVSSSANDNNGGNSSEELLRQLLMSSSKDLYTNIFAFSLTELQKMDSLDSDAVKEVIYSAGAGLGDVSLHDIHKKFDKTIEEIYKPRGSKSNINILLNDLSSIRMELKEHTDDIAKYDSLKQVLSKTEQALRDEEKELFESTRLLEKTKSYAAIYEDWTALCAGEKELEGIKLIASFPLHGTIRLEQLRKEEREFVSRLEQLQMDEQQLKKQLSDLKIEDQLLENSDDIMALQKLCDRFETALREMPLLQDKIDLEKRTLDKACKEIGHNWDNERLKTFDISISVKNSIRELRDQILSKNSDKKRALQILEDMQNRINEATKEKKMAHADVLKEEMPAEVDVNILKNKLLGLKKLIIRWKDCKRDKDVLSEKEEEALSTKEKIENILASISKRSVWVDVGIIAFCIALGAVVLILTEPLPGALIIACSLIAGAIHLAYKNKSIKENRILFNEAEVKLKDIKNRNEHFDEKLCGVRDEIKTLNTELELEDTVDEAELLKFESDILDIEKRKERYKQLNKTHEEKIARCQLLLNDFKNAEKSVKDVTEDEKIIKKDWNSCLNNFGLSQGISPDTALDIVAAISNSKDRLAQINELAKQVSRYNEEINLFFNKAKELFEKCNYDIPGMKEVGTATEKLTRDLSSARVEKEKSEGLQQNQDRVSKEQKIAQKELQNRTDKILSILKEGNNSHTDEEFFKEEGQFNKQQKLLKDIKTLILNIEKRCGQGSLTQKLRNELHSLNPERLKNRVFEYEENIKQTNQKIKECIHFKGATEEQLKKIENEDNVAILKSKEQVLIERLKNEAKKWSIHTLAKTLLSKARERFEKERQPNVIKEANTVFADITDRKYINLSRDIEEKDIYVIDKNHSKKDISELSRGTAEQLYLALRFGLIKEFGRASEKLPVVMDDIMVNFDPARAKSAMKSIIELSQSQQVFMFTCHPSTVEMAKSIEPSTTVFTIKNGTIANRF